MFAKQMFLASEVQIALMEKVIIPHMNNGYWKEHRPAGHGTQWLDVEFHVTRNGQVGPFNFKVPRLYCFTNLEFLEIAKGELLAAAQTVEPNILWRHVRKSLSELSQIVGGRLTDLSEPPTKAFRGNNLPDDRGVGNVLTSGKGVGSEKWLPIMNKLIDQSKIISAQLETTRTYFTLSRGMNKVKVFINGADALVFERGSGETICASADPTVVDASIDAVISILSTISSGKETSVIRSDGHTIIKGDTIIRRVPVVRVTPKAAFTAADPFGVTTIQGE